MADLTETAAGLSAGRDLVRKALFSLAQIHRIHIIGCSRSGTTMLHLAMACFSDVVLSDRETSISYPRISERAELALRFGWRPRRRFYVTKRAASWFKPEHQDQLLLHTRLEKIGLIHIVRDPRDVMLSRHGASKSGEHGEPYVHPEHWYNSIVAADRIFASLSDYPRKITLRYEDLVMHPERSEKTIARTFGLSPNPRALPIDRVKDNFERLKIRFRINEFRALNGLRNMDAGSIGRWHGTNAGVSLEGMRPDIRARFESFCAEYDYPPHSRPV